MAAKIKAENNNAFAFVSPTAQAASSAPAAAAPVNEIEIKPEEYLSYDELAYEPPAHIDQSRKEEYLFDEDFLGKFNN